MSTLSHSTDLGDLDPRLADLGVAGTVLASIALGVATYGALPSTLRVRYTVGPGVHYGPETLPTALVLAGVPVAIVAGYALFKGVGVALARRETAFEPVRPLYDLAAAAALVSLLAVEALLVGLNLV